MKLKLRIFLGGCNGSYIFVGVCGGFGGFGICEILVLGGLDLGKFLNFRGNLGLGVALVGEIWVCRVIARICVSKFVAIH